MASRYVKEVQGYLHQIGWPISVDGVWGPQTGEAVSDFQWGYTFANLPVNGSCDPRSRTYYRLRRCATPGDQRDGYDGYCSPHFQYREFACKGGVRKGWPKVDRELVRYMERYRKHVRHGVEIVSGYRAPDWNARVGGARNSQHKYGRANDLNPEIGVSTAKKLGPIGGIGYIGRTGLVRHVDTGPVRSWVYAIARVSPRAAALVAQPRVYEVRDAEDTEIHTGC